MDVSAAMHICVSEQDALPVAEFAAVTRLKQVCWVQVWAIPVFDLHSSRQHHNTRGTALTVIKVATKTFTPCLSHYTMLTLHDFTMYIIIHAPTRGHEPQSPGRYVPGSNRQLISHNQTTSYVKITSQSIRQLPL